MENYSIERSGSPNLDFIGEIIGQSEGPAPRVKIYRTQGHKYIGQVDANLKFSRAQHFDKPEDAIAWLRKSCSPATDWEDAVEAAITQDDSFKSAWSERID